MPPVKAPAKSKRRVAKVEGGNQKLDDGAGEDADRVGIDPILSMEKRLDQDQHGNDGQVPKQGRDREGAKAVVTVEDANNNPAGPEQNQDGEKNLGEIDSEVKKLALEARGKERHH